MVTVFLRGGLGNQMFQYACGLNLARRNGTELVLDTVHVNDRFPRPHFTYRTFDLDEVFALTPRFTALSRAAQAVPLPGVWLGMDLFMMNVRERFAGAHIVYEDERKGFDPAIFSARGNIILYGRWESEKYFADAADSVRAAFRFRRPLEGAAAEAAKAIRATNSVSLHVRRGDFAANKIELAAADGSYYEKAIAHIASRVRNPHFFIFSDDIAWCRGNIPLQYPATYLDAASAGPHNGSHLHLMSLCKHHIIANSTFSWWGAWLGVGSEKMVIAPKRWPQFSPAAEKDIIPAHWVAL